MTRCAARKVAPALALCSLLLAAIAGARASLPTPAASHAVTQGAAAPLLSHGRFKDLRLFRAADPERSVALLLSGEAGWNDSLDALAARLAQVGALVVGIDFAQFKAALERDGDACEAADGDLENLSHFIQAYVHAPTYRVPLLVGVGAGASFAYAMLAQAPQNTFAAALTWGFCPALHLQKPLCRGAGLEMRRDASKGGEFIAPKFLASPFVSLEGAVNPHCDIAAARAFSAAIKGAASVTLAVPDAEGSLGSEARAALAAAYSKLARRNPTTELAPPPAALNDLPVIEVPALGRGAHRELLALVMSGDGGWAGLDKEVAAALSAQGIPVVGLDSLRYYWTARTPAGLAADTDRLIRFYLAHFDKQRVILIGYSQGADVLPFAINRLPAAARARIALAAFMGLSEHALFEFHLSSWISDDNSGPATLPEIRRIAGVPLLCIYGADESDSLCPKLDPHRVDVVELKGGHHFDGDYANLAQQILKAVPK